MCHRYLSSRSAIWGAPFTREYVTPALRLVRLTRANVGHDLQRAVRVSNCGGKGDSDSLNRRVS